MRTIKILRAVAISQLFAALAFCGQTLDVSPRVGSDTAGLTVRSPLIPGDELDFRTCEGVIAGERDFGLFKVKLAPSSSGTGPGWMVDGKNLRYAWTYPVGITVRFQGVVEPDGVVVEYEVENRTTNALDRVQIHTCITTTKAPSFFPDRKVIPASQPGGAATTNYMELYDRLFLWQGGQPFAFASSPLAEAQLHLSFMRAGEPPVKWGWWVNTPKTFDLPLVAARSRDGKSLVALSFDRAIWASSNVGDDRACFHLFPSFGRIEIGGKSTVRGRLYVMKGSLEKLKKRAAWDVGRQFPAPFPGGKSVGR